MNRVINRVLAYRPSGTLAAIVLLGAGLVLAVGYIIYDRTAPRPVVPKAPSQESRDLRDALSRFLGALQNADSSTKAAHQELGRYLSELKPKALPGEAEIRKIAEAANVPRDYQFFFRECLPRYKHLARGAAAPWGTAPNIVCSLAPGRYRARVAVNSANLSVAGLMKSIGFAGAGNRIVFAGGYTSPFNMPAGFLMSEGSVVNPVLQRSDGLLVIDKGGGIRIMSVETLQHKFRRLDIRYRLEDYQEFVRGCSAEHLSVIQGNLLVSQGRPLIDEKAPQPAVYRRVLFETGDSTVHVYDSLAKPQSLFEVAKLLSGHFGAQFAFNLETGPYNLCQLKIGDRITDYGHAQPASIISNVLVIEF